MSRRKAARPKPATKRKPDVDAMLAEGLALHQRGRIPEAESFYRRALAEQPDHPQANQLMGLTRLQQADAEMAVGLLSKAVRLSPENPQYLCDLGVAQNAAMRYEEAIRSLNRAIDLKPDYAQAHSNLGMTLKNFRRFAPAVESYREAIRLRPNEPGFQLNLGNALSALGDLQEAEKAYRRALDLRPDYPAALSGLALTLSELGRPEDAIALGLDAIKRQYNVAAYHSTLGRSYREARDPEKAVASFRTALEIDPTDMEAVRFLALLERKATADSEMSRLVALIDSGTLNREQEANLAYALGTWFDDLGEYETAFGYYARANTIKRSGENFSMQQVRQDIESITRVFTPTPAWPQACGVMDSPIFIVGLPRSGKTTLEGMLSRHPGVGSAGELKILSILVEELSRENDLSLSGGHVSKVPNRDWEVLGEQYLRQARSIVRPGARPIDTMPPNFRLVGAIRMAMPDAKVIHCVRSPVEHCAELYKKCFGSAGNGYSTDLEDCAEYYKQYRRIMAFWNETAPGFVLDVDLAQIVSAPEPGMRRVLDHCELAFDPACTEPMTSEPRVGESGFRTVEERATRLAPYRAALEPLLAGIGLATAPAGPTTGPAGD